MRRRLIIVATLACAGSVAIVFWALHSRQFGYWLQVHTGTINESGPYYGFWSGFGSDLEEFGVLGAVATGIYQLVKKYNCHEPGCWRVGQHPAAGGQFLLCYRHHPDYRGEKPTHELIERLHHEHIERQEATNSRLHEVHQDRSARPTTASDVDGPQPSAQRLGLLPQSVCLDTVGQAGALSLLALVLASRAIFDIHSGNLAAAAALDVERQWVAEVTGGGT